MSLSLSLPNAHNTHTVAHQSQNVDLFVCPVFPPVGVEEFQSYTRGVGSCCCSPAYRVKQSKWLQQMTPIRDNYSPQKPVKVSGLPSVSLSLSLSVHILSLLLSVSFTVFISPCTFSHTFLFLFLSLLPGCSLLSLWSSSPNLLPLFGLFTNFNWAT